MVRIFSGFRVHKKYNYIKVNYVKAAALLKAVSLGTCKMMAIAVGDITTKYGNVAAHALSEN